MVLEGIAERWDHLRSVSSFDAAGSDFFGQAQKFERRTCWELGAEARLVSIEQESLSIVWKGKSFVRHCSDSREFPSCAERNDGDHPRTPARHSESKSPSLGIAFVSRGRTFM